ncbi:transposase family protein [Streptomyces sp. NPDC059680]|uniref:transposase family protein n=1 Tax=Streptomyces sp. NPDC059680 TaxID=3346904 RepID=UPI00369A0009
MLILADRANSGASATVHTPYHGRDLPEKYTQFDRDHAQLRAPGERAFARLKQWRMFRKARCRACRTPGGSRGSGTSASRSSRPGISSATAPGCSRSWSKAGGIGDDVHEVHVPC